MSGRKPVYVSAIEMNSYRVSIADPVQLQIQPDYLD